MSAPTKIAKRSSSGSATTKDQFFNDGKRQIDYILVYNKNKSAIKRDAYLNALQMANLELESATSVAEQHIVFIKVHAPKTVLMTYANLYDIPVKKQQLIFVKPPRPQFKCMRTELTSQDPTTPNYMRAKETFAYEQPSTLLSYERSMIVYNILKRTDFGIRDFESGIDRLLRQDVFLSAFPLHDGTSNWTDNLNEPLNDRQLLRKFWSSGRMLFKKQPLDIVERYFGVTIAMYFSFLSFYNKMLIFPTILGLSVFAINLSISNTRIINEVCTSNLTICPNCPSCKTETLSDYCSYIKLHIISDTLYTIIYSIVITLWVGNLFVLAAVYLALWKRRQAVLGLRWNITNSKFEEQDIRPEFENIAKTRMTEFGEPEMYIPWYSQVWRSTLSYIFVLLVCILVVAVLAAVVIADITFSNVVHNHVISSILSELLTVLAILAMRRVYNYLVEWVVNLEVPKTQTDFYNSYILKVFLFSFVNNYGTIIYLAYFKRLIYTYPDDPRMYAEAAIYTVDNCGPLGCYTEVSLLLTFIMVLLPSLEQIFNVCKLKYRVWREESKLMKAHVQHHDVPRWEKDYELFHMDPIQQITQYEDIVIQFGYVTLFSLAFPFAPLLALINNLVKTHVEANFFMVKCRRPLAGRTENIGMWMDIIKFLTFASIVTNAFCVAFTSHAIERYIYRQFEPEAFHTIVGYFQTVYLSSYEINTDYYTGVDVLNGTKCWYPKYDHNVQVQVSDRTYDFEDYEEDYKMDDEYNDEDDIFDDKNIRFINDTEILNFRLYSVLLYENFVMFITVLISYAIPGTPSSVTEKYAEFTLKLRRTLNTRASSQMNFMNP